MSVADRLNKLTTDITNAYTSIENKGGTIPANKNTNNLSTAIDSIEVIEQATAEGESLSLVNTKVMPYNDYVVKGKSVQEGTPSPSNPSEIHSVADDVNLVDESLITEYENRGLRWKYDTESKKIKVTGTATSTYSQTDRYSIDLPAGTYIFTAYTESNLRFNVWLYNSSGTLIGNTSTNNPVTINEEVTKITLFCEGTASGITYNEELNVKIQKGTVATPYSPYNQGTVTIKQRGKNLFDKNAVTQGKWLNINGELETAQNYVVSDFIELTEGEIYYIPARQTTRTKYYKSDKSVYSNIWDVSDTAQTITIPSGVKYIRMSILVQGTSAVNLDTFQFEKGTLTPYEPYQGYDKVLQTEPLRSLPNGVRDSLEDDGIHRRVGRIVLDGSDDENWNYEELSYGNNFYINISSAEGGERIPILSNCFKYYERGQLEPDYSCRISTSKNLNLRHQDFTNISDFKTWLSTHNTEVLYKLAEEIIEPLTQNQATTMLDIIKTGSYEGTTNIYTDEDVKPTIGVGYYKKG